MAYFPVFLDLQGQRVLIVGSGPQALEKAQALASFQPELHLLPHLTPADLTPPPALVILTDKNRTQEAALCRSRGIPVNALDDPDNCTFYFPSLITRGSCTIGISSGGQAPALSAALRRQIEAGLPDNLEDISLWLSDLTVLLRQHIPERDRRAKALVAITAEAFQKNRPLSQREWEVYIHM